MLAEDLNIDVNGFENAVTAEHDNPGYDFGALVGYDFGGFRLEAEASFREADVDNVEAFVGGLPSSTATALRLGQYDAAGDVNALSFMLNGLLDFGDDDGLQGYAGGGVGVARVDAQASINATGPGVVDDSDTGFAWQAIAGVRAPISDRWDAGLKYRFFNAPNVNLVDSIGRDLETNFRSHSLLGTLTYNFGGAPVVVAPVVVPPAPPPPPPPPPRPQVVAPVCNKGPYIVFFDWDQSDITPEAATILDSAVTAYASCTNVPIMLAGYTDRSGSVQYNLGLADRRNDSVRGYLTSRGISGGAITSEGFGEANPRVPTADGVRELQNRRVEITYGPGSGM